MKGETLYRHILTDAWNLVWDRKALWVLGFLAVFWGDLGAYQSFNKAFQNIGPSLSQTIDNGTSFTMFLSQLAPGTFFLTIALFFVVFAIILALLVLVTAGRGGLIYAIAKKDYSIRSAVKKGIQAFWPLLGVGIITRIDLLFYAFLISPISGAGISLTIFTIAFVLVTFISIILSFLGVYASALIILEDYSFMQSIIGSLRLFAVNWLATIELALILYIVTLFVGMFVLLSLFALTIPFVMLAFLASAMQSAIAMGIIWVLASIIYVSFLIVIGSAFVTFQYGAWTFLFMRLRSGNALSKIVRLSARFGRVLHRKIV